MRYCKEELSLKSVTIVTNGSKVTQHWMEEYGYYVDYIAVSVDSFIPEVNEKIGRREKVKTNHLDSLRRVKSWCDMYNVLFKMNTVSYHVRFPRTKVLNKLVDRKYFCLKNFS